ncbi:LOW QUALITY PROTEIN: PRELI domain-containing protein 1, mitochondrial, partial [Galemys pyrenaicus]
RACTPDAARVLNQHGLDDAKACSRGPGAKHSLPFGSEVQFRRPPIKSSRMPHWAEQLFPASVVYSVYKLENSTMDPQKQTINHAQLMVVEERCFYCVKTLVTAAGVKSAGKPESLPSYMAAVQEFGLTIFKSNGTKTMRGFDDTLVSLHCKAPSKTLTELAVEVKEKAEERYWQLQRRPRTWPARQPPSSSSL